MTTDDESQNMTVVLNDPISPRYREIFDIFLYIRSQNFELSICQNDALLKKLLLRSPEVSRGHESRKMSHFELN